MIKPSWWTLLKMGLVLREEDTEDPTMSRGSRLMEILSSVKQDHLDHMTNSDADSDFDNHDVYLSDDILDLADF